LAERPRLEELSAAAATLVRGTWSLERSAAALVALYEGLIGANPYQA
jgi:hypothetical protein